MRVLVTGATGFVGRSLCPVLSAAGWTVRASGRREPGSAIEGASEFITIGAGNAEIDWSAAVKDVDAIVHLAARVHQMHESGLESLSRFRAVNVDLTRRLVIAARLAGARRFVCMSSAKVNGEQTHGIPFSETDPPKPRDAYSISKLEAEQTVLAEAQPPLEPVILRPAMVYGPLAPGNFPRLVKLIRAGVPIPLGSIRNQRSFIYVGNLCDIVCRALCHPAAAGETFLVSDGADISTPELVRLMAEGIRQKPRLFPLPTGVLVAMAAAVGRGEEAARLVGSLQVDISKVRRVLEWSPPYGASPAVRLSARSYVSS